MDDDVVIAHLAEACDEAARRAPERVVADLVAVEARLAEPLRVAVAGRVKAGKSTIVNALLGQRVARTDARECTRVVTWFRYGSAERVEVRLRDGTRNTLRLDDDGLVPAEFGVPIEQVGSVHVELSLGGLRQYTLVDTPGLSSPDSATSARASEFLGVDPDSEGAIAGAEAVVFVLNQTVRDADVEVLRAFRGLARSAGSDAVSAVAVLNKVDLLDDPDPFDAGARLAARHAAALRSDVVDVVACSGLFAEAARCGAFTEGDADALALLAASDLAMRERMLLSEARFLSSDHDVPEMTRRRLWLLLREQGLRVCLDAIDRGDRGARTLGDRLLACSGCSTLETKVRDLFAAHGQALKARAAFDELERIAWSAGGEFGGWLKDHLELLRLDVSFHVLEELAALRRIRSGDVLLPDELAAELEHVVLTPSSDRDRDPERVAEAQGRWRRFAFGAGPREDSVARVMIRTYENSREAGGADVEVRR